jgi:hypothetical protein
MAAIVAARIIAITVYYALQGNRLSCTMYYGGDASMEQGDPEALVNAWESSVLPKWIDAVSDQVTFERVAGRTIEPETALPGNDQLNASAGSLVAQAIPSNLAMVLQLRQDDVSSKHNGRLFVSGITETQCVDGLISPTAVGAELGDLATEIINPLSNGSGTTYKLVALTRWLVGIPITPVGYTVTAVSITRSLASQRRRKTEQESYS